VKTLFLRLAAVVLLLVLTPLIAEYLLGNLPTSVLSYLPGLMLLYGAGAVFIRELVRRTGRGWPTLILLATAYGLLEEGIVTQSLFNPNFEHLRLLDYGFVPALGTGLPWAVYVVILHVVWSICVPIGLVEALFPGRRTTPWLGRIGFGVICVLFAAGVALLAMMSLSKAGPIATAGQLAGTGALILALVVAAFAVRRRPVEAPAAGRPAPLILAPGIGVAAFVAGSAFHIVHSSGPGRLPAEITTLAMLALAAGFIGLVAWASRRWAWRDIHRVALVAGGIGVYLWLGFTVELRLHGPASIQGHMVLAAAMLLLTIVACVTAARGPRPVTTQPQS
jgi:hypothetical protein